MTSRPGTRGYADADTPVIVATAHDDGRWHVDQVHIDGNVSEYGTGFERLDLALTLADVLAHAIVADDATRARTGRDSHGIVAVTVADGVYILADIAAGHSGYHSLPDGVPTTDVRATVVRLARAILSG